MSSIVYFFMFVLLFNNVAFFTCRSAEPGTTGINATVVPAANTAGSSPMPRIPLYIGGFFAFPGDKIFGALPYTAQTAVDHINNLTGILDGYELRMRWRLTDGKPADALKLLNDLLYEGPPVLMSWGPIFSRQALVVNEVAAKYNLVQVCLANSQALRDRPRYPKTVQMYWSEDSVNPARVAFINYMKWTKVAIIFEDIEYFRLNVENLVSKLKDANISVIATEAISDVNAPDQQLLSLKRHDARIIFALSYFDTAIRMFCKIYHISMFGPKYVWISIGWYPPGWWEAIRPDMDCTAHELEEALQNHLSVPLWRSVDDVRDIHYNGIRPPEYQLDFIRGLLAREGVDRLEHIESYDVLITIAMALNRSIEKLAQLDPPRALQEFTYEDSNMSAALLESVYETRFVGPTGPILIEDGGYRSEKDVRQFIAQFQGKKSLEIIECVNSCQSFKEVDDMRFHWPGGSAPVDGKTYRTEHVVISEATRLIFYVLSALGILMDLVFLGINVKYREERAIKISTPPLNNLIVLGSLLLYISVFLFGLDESSFQKDTIIRFCHMKSFLVCVGISLAFGALFMKTYRIHAIFSRAVAKLKRVDLPNFKLILGVFLAVSVDIVIFTVWILLGQTDIDEITSVPVLDMSQPERELYIVSVSPYCTSQYLVYFSGVIYITKGILLVFGIFLAWETRTISVSSLNDSTYIAMSIYTVAIFLALVLPTLNLEVVRTNVTTHFAVLCSAIIVTNTTVLCLVFLPKIYLLRKYSRKNFQVSMMTKYISNASMSTFNDCADSNVSRLHQRLQRKEEKLKRLKRDLDLVASSLQKKRPWIQPDEATNHEKEQSV
ncbi:gamma-aminobutyric acid type B receptor subunit 2-like isoform X1 [Asterias rubens]|uniref:gamma-aminobutyric acid type B receptor subunit 2-like isoform X1 n=1 Tax=Asterias rubens TaxID=7604 RepID=UPI00145502E8|nr:gamma-aminobutyric acid type B receptor subunit 2-like isoform X1 [Asterias rubens]